MLKKSENKRVKQLRELLERKLLPYICSDYVYLDLPYHQNIGDLLIWEGTEQFLSHVPFRCLRRASKDTFDYPLLDERTCILLHGGGNFGDLWSEHQDFRLKVMEHYPENRIIILPQTVYYQDGERAAKEMGIMGRHKHLVVCARDKVSYAKLKSCLPEAEVLLLPDMAFCISGLVVESAKAERTLLVKRSDKELLQNLDYQGRMEVQGGLDVLDWPSYENPEDKVQKEFWRLKEVGDVKVWEKYAKDVFLPHYIKEGVKFVSHYEKVYTTRLHVAILCMLLHKPVTLFDNIYGKNRDFYDTWLKSVRRVSLAGKEETSLKKFLKRLIDRLL